MGQVVGIGGVFLKAADAAATKAWYAKVLGLEFSEWGSAMLANPTIGMQQIAAFGDAGYFAPSTRGFMLNLIVDDLDAVLARAAAAGVTPTGREDHDYGGFAWLMDPDGVKVELWQPKADAPG